jgi:hypothetical protein
LIRGVYERWDRDLSGGVRGTGAGSKDTGASSTDVSAGERDKDEDTEEATRKRKVADNKGREWGAAERPQAGYKKDKQVETGKGREDDGEWLIIDFATIMVCFFSISHTVMLRHEAIRTVLFGLDSGVFVVSHFSFVPVQF